MSSNMRQAVRALILDDDDHVLLCRFEFPTLTVWALPGGGLEPDESHDDGLRRELREELGLTEFEIGPHIWTREHAFPMNTGHDGQVDRIHLVRRPRFDPQPEIGWDMMRAGFVQELRWWHPSEIVPTDELEFAPRRLAALLADLLHTGAPEVPIDTGV